MSTTIDFPWRVARSQSAPASARAGSLVGAAALLRSSMWTAPASSSSTSMPAAAAGKSPTGVRTEKRPPTPAGIGRAREPSALTVRREGPHLGAGEEPDGREEGEAPADAGGDRQVAEALVVDDLAERARLGVGRDDQMRLV